MKTILFNPGNDITDAKYIRTKVFIEEQGFSIEGEFDDTDNLAHHLVYYNEDDKPIATCRFLIPSKNLKYIILEDFRY